MRYHISQKRLWAETGKSSNG